MKLGEITKALISLLEDASEAETYLDNNPHLQFARRTYIRSVFSCMEGTIWILKDVCFNAKPVTGKRIMTVAEFAMLREESYELKNNGETRTLPKFLRFPDNIKFTFKTINKLFHSSIDLEIGGKKWNNLLESIEIRNRIMHPKKATSFFIFDQEIEICKDTSDWFNDLTHESIKALAKRSEESKKEID